MLELIINGNKEKKDIMLVQDGQLVERHEEHKDKKRLEGNIYIGKVKEVLPGMQSAFIDIGTKKNTFMRLKDALPKIDETQEIYDENINIKDVVKRNDTLLIQIKRDETMKKGARVSTHINLSGRFSVVLPGCNIITVSQKIENKEEIERLKEIAKKTLPKDMGAILRTSAEKMQEDVIIEDLNNLMRLWKKIKKSYEEYSFSGPKLIYDNKALMRRTLIDIVDQRLDRVIVNEKRTYEDVKEILTSMGMNEKIEVILKENENLSEMYTLSRQIEKLENRKIWLKCGGFITIDKTEALTAIDVNTGKFTGKGNLEDTILEVNKQAAIEISKQLRLRDIGGIIIVDFIDMKEEKNKKEIVNILKEYSKMDRTKNQIMGFTKLNLLEMTRKNMCNNDNF